jgi:hypothetical protein
MSLITHSPSSQHSGIVSRTGMRLHFNCIGTLTGVTVVLQRRLGMFGCFSFLFLNWFLYEVRSRGLVCLLHVVYTFPSTLC